MVQWHASDDLVQEVVGSNPARGNSFFRLKNLAWDLPGEGGSGEATTPLSQPIVTRGNGRVFIAIGSQLR